MNINEFKDSIRSIIREELSETLPEILDEYFNKKKSVASVKEESSVKTNYTLNELIGDRVVPNKEKTKSMKTYVKNPVLNAVLNETVIKPGFSDDPYSPKVSSDVGPMATDDSHVINEGLSSVVKSAITRDYSKLLKAVDSRVKQTRG